jgi:hypothetical protein
LRGTIGLLLDHADEADAIIAQLREALAELQAIACDKWCEYIEDAQAVKHEAFCERAQAALAEGRDAK